MSAEIRPTALPETGEVIVSHAGISRNVSRLVASGRLRKLASRLYTSDLNGDPDAIVRRNRWDIVAGYFPGALVADRTALEFEPADDGSVCLVTPTGSDIDLPGLRLRPRRGAGPTAEDRPFMAGLFLSSQARAFLDNLRPSRARRGRCRRTLPRERLEAVLERLIGTAGIEAVNRLRDDARRIAPQIHRDAEAELLASIIGAMAGSRDAPLANRAARARSRGMPYDPQRVALFERLQAALLDMGLPARPTATRDGTGHATLAFYEAYFSNFIEGTEFEVEEAARIVFDGRIPAQRPEDAHDILGVWKLVSDVAGMRDVPDTASAFVDLLRARHARVLAGRPTQDPGRFKTVPNRVGGTAFVSPDAVVGTLQRSFDLYRALDTPFRRAVFIHFLVTEVHPFADGNGRVARIMMNAELIAANEERVVIPTVYRPDYIAAQRALSVHAQATPVVRMLDFAQRWTGAVDWTTVTGTANLLRRTNAFLTEQQADAAGVRLALPAAESAAPFPREPHREPN